MNAHDPRRLSRRQLLKIIGASSLAATIGTLGVLLVLAACGLSPATPGASSGRMSLAPADSQVWQAVRHALPADIPVYQPGFVPERFGTPVVEGATADGPDGPSYTVVYTAPEENLVFIHGAGKGAWGDKPPPETATSIVVNGAPGTFWTSTETHSMGVIWVQQGGVYEVRAISTRLNADELRRIVNSLVSVQ
jgi:hypothetical protein